MDSVDPGALLASMSPKSGSSAPSSNIDAQIMALLQQSATASAPATAASDQQSAAAANASAAQTAGNKPQTLQVGLGPWYRHDTGIPIPHFLSDAMSGIPGEAVRLGQGLKQSLGMQTDPLLGAVTQQVGGTPGGLLGSMVTDTALSAPIGGAATAGLAKLGGVGAGIAANTLGRAAVQGSVQGAITAPPGQRLQGAGLGAALSPVLPLVGAGLGKVATGLSRTPEAQALLNRGVQLTPGQMNPGGALNRVEQGLTALPLVGGRIASARAAAVPQVARSIFKDALAPGDTLPDTITDANAMIASMDQGFDHSYDTAVHGYGAVPEIVNVNKPNVPLSAAFAQIAAKQRPGLPTADRAQIGQQLQDQLQSYVGAAQQKGQMFTDDLQQLRSDLRLGARSVSPIGNAAAAQRDMWNEAQDAVTQALDSQLPPKAAAALKATDAQYRNFATLRNAVVAAKDKPLTLTQLSTAVKNATPASTYAAGGGWNRDALKAAEGVFGSTVPMTGLTGAGTVAPILRGIEGGLGLGIGAMHPGAVAGMAAHPLAPLATAAGLGGLWSAYTRPGLRALSGQTAPQQAIQGLLSALSPNAKAALSRYGRAGLLSGLLQPQIQGGGLLSAAGQ